MRYLPNIISFIRILLIIPLIIYLAEEKFFMALWIFVIAAISDGVDGFLARRFNWMSQLGAFLDPLADKLLVGSVFIMFTILGYIPIWLLVVIIIREVVISGGVWLYRWIFGEFTANPSFISKINTLVQIVFTGLILLQANFHNVPMLLIVSIMQLLLITTMLSLFHYMWVWGRRAIAHSTQ